MRDKVNGNVLPLKTVAPMGEDATDQKTVALSEGVAGSLFILIPGTPPPPNTEYLGNLGERS